MKSFDNHKFDFKIYRKELIEFKSLLDSKDELSENDDILPFFRKKKHLSSQIATIVSTKVIETDKIAQEFDLFSDFASDMAIGDSKNNIYCFIEFEDAKKHSLFKKNGAKYKPEYSNRLEHGLSQVIDWFYKLEGQQNTDAMEERFGKHKIEYEGILIIGRTKYLNTSTKRRLNWRNRNVVINSKHVNCYTFDELYETLNTKLYLLEKLAE